MAKKKGLPASPFVPVEEQSYSIPENWCWIKFSSIMELISGRDAALTDCNSEGHGIPYILGASSIENNTFTIERWIETPQVISNKGDILLSVKGTIGKLYIQQEEKVNISRQIMAIRPTKILNNKLAHLFLQLVCDELREAGNGLIPGISRADVLDKPFPFMPLPEQHRIVSRIESLFAKLDEAKEKAQTVVDGFELRKSAILHKAFTGELTEQWRKEHGVGLDSWKRKKYSEFCNIVRGGSPRPAGSPEFYGGNIPFMKVADITRNTGPYVNSTEYTIKEAGLKKTRMVQANTLLLTNSGATLGVPAICTFDTTFNDGIAAFLGLDSEYLLFHYYFWTSKTAELRGINKGAAQPNLNTDIIGSVEINMPKEAEQKEIIHIIDKLLDKEQQAKEAAEAVLSQIDTMKKAILARAFRGELGTNDPAEEWAGELVREMLKTEVPTQPRARAVFIPEELEKRLESELERKIIKLYLKNDSATLSIDVLMAVSSKKFEVMDALRNLEQRGIIKKLNNGNYSLVR